MATQVPKAIEDAACAMFDAEHQAGSLRDILTVLHMAIGFETEGLDAEERSGMEAVINHARLIASKNLDRVATANSAVKRLLETYT